MKLKNKKKRVNINKATAEEKLASNQVNPVKKNSVSFLNPPDLQTSNEQNTKGILQPTPTTLPRTSDKIDTNPAKPTSLPRPPKPPRKPTGYVSPAASLRRQSKIDIFKGLSFKKLENLPEILKHSVPNYS